MASGQTSLGRKCQKGETLVSRDQLPVNEGLRGKADPWETTEGRERWWGEEGFRLSSCKEKPKKKKT